MLVFPPVVVNSSFGRFPGAVTRYMSLKINKCTPSAVNFPNFYILNFLNCLKENKPSSTYFTVFVCIFFFYSDVAVTPRQNEILFGLQTLIMSDDAASILLMHLCLR